MSPRSYEPDRLVSRLASEAGVSRQSVDQYYRHALEELSEEAHVTDYVHLFARRRLIAALREAAHSRH